MSGNTLGKLFTVTSFGESHGPALGCIVDGCPPGLELSEADIQPELERRRTGTSRHTSQRKEPDQVKILSGVFEGRTTGTPIGLLIRNVDAKSKDYSKIKDMFRPGHADYTYWQKYGIRDYRGGGRQSARETAVRVAAGAIAKKWLIEQYAIEIRGYMAQLGPIEIPFKSWDGVYENPFFAADPGYVARLEEFMDKLRKSGDSCGAKLTVVAEARARERGAGGRCGVGVHEQVPVDELSLPELRRIFLGERQSWSRELTVTLLLPPRGTAERQVLLDKIYQQRSEVQVQHYWINRLFGEEVQAGPKITGSGEMSVSLVRVMLPSNTGLFPEISAGQHRFTVRFVRWRGVDARPAHGAGAARHVP